jgi:hypothetical protein
MYWNLKFVIELIMVFMSLALVEIVRYEYHFSFLVGEDNPSLYCLILKRL